MRRFHFDAFGLALAALAVNAWTALPVLRGISAAFAPGAYGEGLAIAAATVCDLWLLALLLLVLWRRQPLPAVFRETAVAWAATALAGTLLLLTLNPLLIGRWPWLHALLPLAMLYPCARALHAACVRAGAPLQRGPLRAAATLAFAMVVLWLLAETAFVFVARSQLNDAALASRVWFARHWQVTAEGYREAPALQLPDAKRRQLVFIGDSFTAGHGVADPQERFSDRVAVALGPEWQVHNHGQNGANTEDELSQLSLQGAQPTLVVLGWFLNDIQEQALAKGIHTGNQGASRFPISLIHGSLSINYLYHNWPQQARESNYLTFLKAAFADPVVMETHQRSLRALRQAAESRGARFVVMLFPLLQAVQESAFALEPMEKFWRLQGVPCLNLAPVFAPHAPQALIVNASDTHPNEFAHGLVADTLLTFLQNLHLLSDSLSPQAAMPAASTSNGTTR